MGWLEKLNQLVVATAPPYHTLDRFLRAQAAAIAAQYPYSFDEVYQLHKQIGGFVADTEAVCELGVALATDLPTAYAEWRQWQPRK